MGEAVAGSTADDSITPLPVMCPWVIGMAYYEIRVSGILPCETLAELEHLTADPQPVQTVLCGMLDQPTLKKLLTRLELFGAHIIEMRLAKSCCLIHGERRASPPAG